MYHAYKGDEDIDFTQFWLLHAIMFPILALIARRIMAGNACSSDVERLFSRAGIIFSPLRSNLKPVTLQQLTSLHYWYRNEHNIGEANKCRENETARRCDKFATLVLRSERLVVNDGEDYCDSDSSDEDD